MLTRSVLSIVLVATLVSQPAPAAPSHPVETALRVEFPALSLESAATFESSEAASRTTSRSGLRARFRRAERGDRWATMPVGIASRVEPLLDIVYPHQYDGMFVVQLGPQRVVLRAAGAAGAPAIESAGKLIYSRPYPSVDVVQVPRLAANEELLLFHDSRAPHVFDYDIIETEGVSRVALDDGAIRFLPAAMPAPSAAPGSEGCFVQPQSLLQIDPPWLIDAAGTRHDKRAEWTLIGSGSIPTTLRLTIDTRELPFPIVVDPTFSVVGSLGTPRDAHTATLLTNGKVLVAGGFTGSTATTSAELYDRHTRAFSPTGSLHVARQLHTATLLPNGKVLIVGGIGANGAFLASAELYDPWTNTFSTNPHWLATARAYHSATLLPDGKVLIIGGGNASSSVLAPAEVFDPATGIFVATGSLATARRLHCATVLKTGKVLVTGGRGLNAYLNAAEIYDPASGTFAATGNMTTLRSSHVATRLHDGTVLIAGGYNGAWLGTAELFNPSGAGTFANITWTLATARAQATATLLPNGKVLIAGGENAGIAPLMTAELFDPSNATFSAAGMLATSRAYHTATILPNAQVLFVGGFTTNQVDVGAAELYEYGSGSFSTTGSLAHARDGHTATALPSGRVMIAGGSGPSYLDSIELFEGASFTSGGTLKHPRTQHRATLLATGKVLVTGGRGYVGVVSSAELYNPATEVSTLLPIGMSVARYDHTSTLLPDGRVLVIGGDTLGGVTASAEVYDPATNAFSATDSLRIARSNHTATLLSNGKVLVTGGSTADHSAPTLDAELYDPATGMFSGGGLMTTSRSRHTATLLANGKVLITGGYSTTEGNTTSAELYDPSSRTFSKTGSMKGQRNSHNATLLADGTALIVGGNLCPWSAERYDPRTGTFTETLLITRRRTSTSTLLRTGKVLVAGGYPENAATSDVEIYDPGIGNGEPASIATFSPSDPVLPATLSITGTNFRSASEGSSGGTNSSPANYPILQLQRVDNEQIVVAGPSSEFSDTSMSVLLNYLPTGTYRASIVTNGVAGTQRFIHLFRSRPAITGVSPDRGPVSGGQSVTITGTNLQGVSVTMGGTTAVVTATTDTSVTVLTPAHPLGAVDVVVLTPTRASATAVAAYSYMADPPTNVVATAISRTSVEISWSVAPGATAYEVLRSADGFTWERVKGTERTVALDTTATADNAYLYKVRATAPAVSLDSMFDLATTVIFTDEPLYAGKSCIRAVHIMELRTAVSAVRRLAGLRGGGYTTDPSITPGVTTIKGAHVTELRTALTAARTALSLPGARYGHWSVSARDPIATMPVGDLREAVK